ncbi:MAG: phosphoenolpyruvate--protein phosphotransferase [Erysipelotrichaceae bacterium]|nr:phosphoenolpyruvate--protein phosphotransferase [Erysipelotrichaceae bacterium]
MKGIAVSSGIAIAQVFKFERPVLTIIRRSSEPVVEIERLQEAIKISSEEIEGIKEKSAEKLSLEEQAIFDAHLALVNDPELYTQVVHKIEVEQINAEYAVEEVANIFIHMFESLEDEYMRARASDIKDVTYRVMAHLCGVRMADISLIDHEVILVAEELTPSDTAQLDKRYIKGFVTEQGGRTSHSAIMARSIEIPAVVGVKEAMNMIEHGEMIILDAIEGNVIIAPSDTEIQEYTKKSIQVEEEKKELVSLIEEETVTLDGVHIELSANIGNPKNMEAVIRNGADGVGLYRTEFLYMDASELPSEEEQYQAYKAVLESIPDKRVVIRTLDIGGDKKLPYLNIPEEMNPFLGHRAVRLCLDRTDIFRTQLRALLRASVHGRLAIMFPMIATLQELRDAKRLLNEEKESLLQEGYSISNTIEVGMMVEIPSAAVMADKFAKEVDFFSIGTNDLIQYAMAADRMSDTVAYLYQPYHPSVLHLIKLTVDGAHKAGIWCGMCGEMAGEWKAVPLLVGLGLDEFSVVASGILPIRKIIRSLNKKECEDIAARALACSSSEEALEVLGG